MAGADAERFSAEPTSRLKKTVPRTLNPAGSSPRVARGRMLTQAPPVIDWQFDGARTVPVRSARAGRGASEKSDVFRLGEVLRTGTVRGPPKRGARPLARRIPFRAPSALTTFIYTGVV